MPTSIGSIILSPSVEKARSRFGKNKPVHAIDLAREILRYHISDYAPSKAKDTLNLLNEESKKLLVKPDHITGNSVVTRKEQSSEEWLQEVISLYETSKVTILHGRIVLIGLSLLEKKLRFILDANGFLGEIVRDVEDFPYLLSSGGRNIYNLLAARKMDDYLENLGDIAVQGKEGDELDRFDFAEFLVKLLNNTNLSEGSYALHLYAPWGAGKTSVMNFMKEILRKDEQQIKKGNWHVVDFNAWQNQRLAYPWWTLMKCIRREMWTAVPFKMRFWEWWWRFRTARLHYIVSIVVISWLVVIFLIPYLRSKGEESNVKGTPQVIVTGTGKDKKVETATSPIREVFENIDKTIAAIISISAVVLGLSKGMLSGAQKSAKNYIDAEEDPMATLKKRFKRVVSSIKPAKIAVFIDDLDRCKSAYVVDLLENIQTLFKEANVVFVIAADVKWIHACYEVEYEKIKPYILAHGKPIGPLFVEKMFQLSVALPGVAEEIKEKLWYALLCLQTKGGEEVSEPEIPTIQTVNDREEFIREVNKKSFSENHAIRLEILRSLADKQTLEQTEHFLKPYSIYLDLNPRSMKRLLNSYTVNKASSLISHIDISAHQLALWTIVATRWPVLADFMLENPDLLEKAASGDNTFPDPVKALWNRSEVQRVLKGVGQSSPLEPNTLLKCRLLFL